MNTGFSRFNSLSSDSYSSISGYDGDSESSRTQNVRDTSTPSSLQVEVESQASGMPLLESETLAETPNDAAEGVALPLEQQSSPHAVMRDELQGIDSNLTRIGGAIQRILEESHPENRGDIIRNLIPNLMEQHRLLSEFFRKHSESFPASEVRNFSSNLKSNVKNLKNLSEVASSEVANKVVEALIGISNAVDCLKGHLSAEEARDGQNLWNIRTLEMPNGHDGSLNNQSDINSISSLSNSEHRPSTNTGSQTTGTHSLNHSSEEILGDSLSSFTHDDFPPSANPVNQTRPLVQGEAVNENGSFEGNSSMRTDVLNPPLITLETGATPLAHGYPVIQGQVMDEAALDARNVADLYEDIVNNRGARLQEIEEHTRNGRTAIDQSGFVLARIYYRAINNIAQNEIETTEQHQQENDDHFQNQELSNLLHMISQDWLGTRNRAQGVIHPLTSRIQDEIPNNHACAIS